MEYVEGRLLKDIIHDGPLEPGRGRARHRRRPHGARVLAPRRRRAPRHQARQHHGHHHRPGEGHGLRHRPRRLRLVDDGRADHRHPRHRLVLLARAGQGRDRRRPHRPVLDRRRALRDAHRPAAVPRRHPGGGRLPARERAPGQAERHQPEGLPGARRRRAARARQGPRAAVPDGGGVPRRRRHRGIRAGARAPPARRGDDAVRCAHQRRSRARSWRCASSPRTRR